MASIKKKFSFGKRDHLITKPIDISQTDGPVFDTSGRVKNNSEERLLTVSCS